MGGLRLLHLAITLTAVGGRVIDFEIDAGAVPGDDATATVSSDS